MNDDGTPLRGLYSVTTTTTPMNEQPQVILPFRLTVRQFACCIQRCEETVCSQIRARNIEAEGRPYLIHPRELEKFHVDPLMALERLKLANLLAPRPHKTAA